jgi:DNA repair exonuclease SbcCD ATPase subunit
MKSRDILKEEVEQLISQSFWGKSGVSLTENTEQQVAEEAVEAEEAPSEAEVVEEQAHVCPLCESHLEEAISDEQLTEHIEMMLGIINEMNDISDEELEAIEEEIDSELGEEEVDEVEEVVEAKKPKMLKGAKSKASC